MRHNTIMKRMHLTQNDRDRTLTASIDFTFTASRADLEGARSDIQVRELLADKLYAEILKLDEVDALLKRKDRKFDEVMTKISNVETIGDIIKLVVDAKDKQDE